MFRTQRPQCDECGSELHRRGGIELLVLGLRGDGLAIESFDQDALEAVEWPRCF
jgi:hypothetical protein